MLSALSRPYTKGPAIRSTTLVLGRVLPQSQKSAINDFVAPLPTITRISCYSISAFSKYQSKPIDINNESENSAPNHILNNFSYKPTDRNYHSRGDIFTHCSNPTTYSNAEINEPQISFEEPNSEPETLTHTPTESNNTTNRISLRHYQEDCIEECLSSFNEGKNRVAISLATGSGKTVIFSHLLEQVKPQEGQGNCVLILVHRRELALQAQAMIERVHPNLNVQIEMGKFHASTEADVIIASVATISNTRSKRLEDDHFDPSRFKLLIIDEAHHAAAPSYMRILKHFGANEKNSKVYVAGFSATLSRLDGLSLEKAMDTIVYHRGMLEMIDDGHLSDLRITSIKASYDLQTILDEEEAKLEAQERERLAKSKNPLSAATKKKKKKTPYKKADYSLSSLSKILDTDSVNELIFRIWNKNSKTYKSSLIFCVDVNHTKNLFSVFRNHGINADYITGDTQDSERASILRDFKDGKIPVLLNCAILTEGTDIPNIDAIFLVRPTRSQALLVQMIGRGLRLHSGKTHCHIFDFVSVTSAHKSGMLTAPTLVGLDPDKLVEDASLMDLKKQKEEEDQALQNSLEEKKAKKKDEDKNKDKDKVPEDIQKDYQMIKDGQIGGINIKTVQLETYEGLIDFLKLRDHELSPSGSNGVSNQGQTEYPSLDIFKSKYGWITVGRGHYILTSPGKTLSLKADKKKKNISPFDEQAIHPDDYHPGVSITDHEEEEKEGITWTLEQYNLLDKQLLNDSSPNSTNSSPSFANKGKVNRKTVSIKHSIFEDLPSSVALNAADSYARKAFPEKVMVLRSARWRKDPITGSQAGEIKRLINKMVQAKDIKQLHESYITAGKKEKPKPQPQPQHQTETKDEIPPPTTTTTLQSEEPDSPEKAKKATNILNTPMDDNLDWVEKLTKGDAAELLTRAKYGGLRKGIKEFYRRVIKLRKAAIRYSFDDLS